jgi:glycosyltransferase involved in cell wall biosynthesis
MIRLRTGYATSAPTQPDGDPRASPASPTRTVSPIALLRMPPAEHRACLARRSAIHLERLQVRLRPMTSGAERPSVSVGLAVRNGVGTIERCVTSILGQSLESVELIISDNASDDGTSEILERLAREDPRIKLDRLVSNIGQHGNMNRVFDLATAPLYRWISADDWLEERALAACVGALEARPDAIGATSYFRIHSDTGLTRYEEYRGEFPDAADPVRRLRRMLWFFHAGDAKYDPIYGVFRRSALLRTPRIRHSEQADWLLCAELALVGPIVNVDECLAHRTRTYAAETRRRAYRRRMHPDSPDAARSSALRFRRDMLQIIASADLSAAERKACSDLVFRFTLKDFVRRARQQMRWAGGRILRRVPGGDRLLGS